MHVADLHFIAEPWRVFVWVILVFIVAWIVSRASKRVAEWAVARYERRHTDVSKANTGAIIGLRRRETIISLVQTSVRYAAYGIATVVSIVQLAGLGSRGALAGASLVVVLVGFAAQRFLIDILTGFFMQFEGWFSIGDTITIEPWGLEGIVEEISLRYTRLRALNGELLFVHNSQVNALRRLPRGLRELNIELFVRDASKGREVFEDAAAVMPIGPTEFVRPPWIEDSTDLEGGLVQLRARATVAPGREWLATGFLVDVIRERAPEGLIVHGPVVFDHDELARQRFARATPAARTAGR
jgi:hypothetical protein